MSMQISVDPSGLTQAQREAVAGFILAYPSSSVAGVALAEIHEHTHTGISVGQSITGHPDGPLQIVGTSAPNPIEDLAKEGGEFEAGVAFGGHGSAALDLDAANLNAVFGQGAAGATLGDVSLAPAAAFGGSPPPLPLGATPAPSIAGVVPFSTAPVATPTLIAPGSVPVPPAPNAAHIPPAPIAAPQTGNHAGGVELDKEGLPWDARIHAESKAKIADGTWRKKRNLDPALKATVEAELRQLMGAPVAVNPLAGIPAPAANPGVPSAQVTPIPFPTPVVATMSAPGTVAAPSVDARAMFVGLVGRASAAIQAGKVTQAEIAQCCAAHGVSALPLLANRLELVPQVAAQVDFLIASRP